MSAPSSARLILRPLADAPPLPTRSSAILVRGCESIAALRCYIRAHLRLAPEVCVFLYVRDAFAPPSEEALGALSLSHASDGVLTVSYSLVPIYSTSLE